MPGPPDADLPAPGDRLVTLPEGLPELTLGWEAIWWARDFLRHPDGPRAGEPWKYSESQLRFVLWWYALRDDMRWVYAHGARRLAKGTGKALALDTPLPTPSGWTTMGDVQPGDQLLDEAGQPCTVLAATEVMHGRPCYRLGFRDRTSVVCDAEHLWPADEFIGDRLRKRRLLPAAEIASRGLRYERVLTSGRTKCAVDGVSRWRTLPTPPLALPDADLPLPPYLLGYWLGDGDSDAPRITIDRADLPEFSAAMELAGVHLGEPRLTGNPSGHTYRVRFGHLGEMVAILRGLGVLNNKHIPAVYLRASHKQRLDLLRGLMDSDGCAFTGTGRGSGAELTLTSRRLAADAVALIRTLGLYPRMKESDAVLNRRVVGRRWRIHVTAYADEPVFSLARKAARLRPQGPQIPYSQVRTITSAEPVRSVPVRCVTVSSPSSLYLAGEGMVPTHNSPSAAALAMTEFLGPVRPARRCDHDPDDPRTWGGVRGRPVDMPLVQIAGVSESATANTMRHIRAMTAKSSKVVKAYHLDPGKTVIYSPGGGQLEVITSSAAAAEGALVTAAVLDETEHWRSVNGGTELAAVLDRNLAKSPGARAIETANAWEPGAGSVAEDTYDAWVAQEEGRTRSRAKILYDAQVAPPDTDLTDDASLRAGIAHAYGDSFWVDQETIRDRVLSLRTKPDTARRFYLNQPVASMDSWVTPQEWARLADPSFVVGDGDEIVAFFDGSKSQDATALIGCHVESGYVFTIGVWEPGLQPNMDEVPAAEVDAAVEMMFDRWDVRAFWSDVREWESFAKVTWPERYSDQVELWAVPHGKEPHPVAWDMRTRVYDFTMACELTLTEITGEDPPFRHDGDSRLGRHVVNARRHPNRWGVSIAKESRESPRKIDAAVCMIGARMIRRLLLAARGAKSPDSKPRSGRVHGFA